MPIPLRGLKNLRTMAGRVDRLTVPYMAQMQITCLEIEKARRTSERRSASRRVAEIDSRLQEIEVEKQAILRALADRKQCKGADMAKGEPGTRPRRTVAPFRIQY
ncbi:MAG: hypothetical protein LAP13_00525 [Acidobacteriia bacterium]|nr:hypothetical protein [Terriglobia bacterium]